MQCMKHDCQEELTEQSRIYVGRNAYSKNEVWKVFYECPQGHKYQEKIEIEGTANSSAK